MVWKLLELDIFTYHRAEILKYLRSDCENLYEMLRVFHADYGKFLTIGGAAFSQLRSMHDTETTHARHDAMFRPFYHGGRVQCFQDAGIHTGDFRMFDVNSMYPFVMQKYQHPIGLTYFICGGEVLDNQFNINKNISGLNGKNMYFFAHFLNIYNSKMSQNNVCTQLKLDLI